MATVPPRPLSVIVNSRTSDLHELPLVHTTKTEYIHNIISACSLSPSPCPVFKEPLLYLFYGRPAYRIAKPDKPTTDVIYCPICLVFKPYSDLKGLIARIFPFDSGAGTSGRFNSHIRKDELDRYQLTPLIESAKQVVSLFFGENRKYYFGKARAGLSFAPEDATAAKYYTLVSELGTHDYDDRRSAIEIQARTSFVLRDALLAVVLPECLLDLPVIRDTIIRDWRALPLTYGSQFGGIPSEYSAIIREKLDEFYSRHYIY